jgi:predicted dehydrogenase
MTNVCRWGFLSTAGIGRKNWKAIHRAPNAMVAAVASRDFSKAQTFIAENQSTTPFTTPPRAYGDYKSLIIAPDIDAIYVPLPTALRKTWVIAAAEAGKHVLCEKPCASNLEDLRAMVDACQANNVQFMDGVMFMHSRRLPAIKTVLEDRDRIGTLRRIGVQFSFCGPDAFFQSDIRTHSQMEPQGCLGDLGWYCIRMILWAMNGKLPSQVSARILTEGKQPASPANVPLEFSAELLFEENISASFYCSFITEHQQFVRFCGSKGYVQLDDFVLPYLGSELNFDIANHTFQVLGCDFNMERHVERRAVREYPNSWPNSQETNMIRTFSDAVLTKSPDAQWPKWSLATQSVLDACLESARSGKATQPQTI